MKLDMNLKPNDIVLLKILACVLIVFLFVRFAIFPMIEKHQNLVDEKEKATMQQEEMQYAINTIPVTEKNIENQKTMLADATTDFYGEMENQEIDELVTGLVLQHALFPVSLNISETTQDIPTAYQNDDQTQTTSNETLSAEEELNKSSSSEDLSALTAAAEAAQIHFINTTNVSLTIEGSEESIIEFLDDIAKHYLGIQVRSFEMQEKSYVNSTLEDVTLMRCNCELAIYSHGEIETN